MPAQETSHRFQDAVLWPWASYDAYGENVVGTPVDIKVRWEWKRRQMTNSDGNSVAVDATAVVDREIAEGSNMWLGTYEDFLAVGSAGDDTQVMEVLTYNETPDLKNRVAMRTVGLAFFRDDVPTGA